VSLALAVAVPSLVLIVSAGVDRQRSDAVEVSEATASHGVPLRRGDLVFTGLSIVGDGEGGGSSSLVADRVHVGKRTSLGGLLVYHDLEDLFVSRAVVRLRPGLPGPDGAATSFNLLAELSRHLDPILGAGDVEVETGRGRQGVGLSRIRFEGLSITAELGNRRTLSIVARQARTDPKFENLAFHRSVTITDAEGIELRAVEAVWSRKFAGIYLPGGHWIQDRYREGEAFFVVSGDGTLASRRPIPSIAYRDEIEEMEARIGAKVLGDSFPGLRAALGISSGSY
jgi:hypothetical protein